MPNIQTNSHCDTCNNILTIPIISSNNVISCFLCLMNKKGHIQYNSYNLYNYVNNYIWLYSSNYNGLWWCYNTNQNNQVERTYKDYLIRQPLDKNTNDITVKINLNKSDKNANYYGKNKIKFHIIDVESDDDNKLNFTDKEIINCASTSQDIISYTISIQSHEYKLDFDSMKQINLLEIWKKRSIRRLTLPSNMSSLCDIIDYLKSQNVIGITGLKWK